MDKVDEIRRLYYQTTRATITHDLARAIQILRSMASDEERQRAAVYMDGLSQMRSEWRQSAQRSPRGGGAPPRGRRS